MLDKPGKYKDVWVIDEDDIPDFDEEEEAYRNVDASVIYDALVETFNSLDDQIFSDRIVGHSPITGINDSNGKPIETPLSVRDIGFYMMENYEPKNLIQIYKDRKSGAPISLSTITICWNKAIGIIKQALLKNEKLRKIGVLERLANNFDGDNNNKRDSHPSSKNKPIMEEHKSADINNELEKNNKKDSEKVKSSLPKIKQLHEIGDESLAPKTQHRSKKQLVSSYYTKIVGVTFEDRQQLIKHAHDNGLLDVDKKLLIRHNKNNPHDSNCIEICLPSGVCLGYIAKEANEEIVKNLQNGFEYVVKSSGVTGLNNSYSLGLNIHVEVYK